MHLFQLRPQKPTWRSPGGAAPGRCYWAPQSSLFFGDDRHESVAWRRVISWAVRGNLVHVFPTTTKKCNDFLLVDRRGCTLPPHTAQRNERDSYVCPRVEVLPMSELIEVGVLHESAWQAIVQWKRQREERR
jgi:hypothetical protein